MKRTLTFLAVAALAVGVSVPAASSYGAPVVVPEPTPELAPPVAESSQEVAVTASAPVLVTRDTYAAVPSPPPVPQFSSSAYSGPVPDMYQGLFTLWPVPGARMNQGFGVVRANSIHEGIDIMAPSGKPIYSVNPGTVVKVGWDPGGWGQYVKINHGDGVQTLYAHMIEGSPTVVAGQLVELGDQIGLVGETGNAQGTHVHFEVYLDGKRANPEEFFEAGVVLKR